ncbi:MAG: N-acetyltransferase [Bacteroidetes bacterium CG02_land_8_20_14_3_00_31_25]|nr:GNAT family N-acetyltransferase [Bacteroidota bacterium]PIV58782.1 MAG: N-acetyltransferase [Bacteroidetes bacterium CG02_land_8_20_14_3_00_31_25]PIX35468.1 MAG: N-acetyltransferase [Bacteroidetes bacterium CG_4_8_14_3_um_filter_31_14]PIY02953.1 MAG: N-acetyltransferase [Bacteroidetes bacterium CG_4_10_14_3_um_filter_31_20]
MNIIFRNKLKESDLIDIKNIIESTGFFYDYEILVAVELANEAIIKGQKKSEYFFQFIEVDGKTISYSCYGPIACAVGSYDLYWIATHNDFRGKGIGKLILEKTHEAIKKRNGRLVITETSGTEKYIPTRKFYENNGYKAEAIIKDFYQPGDDKYMFVFRL